MKQATKFITKQIDINNLMTSLDREEIPSEQDFDKGVTVWTFSDGSKIKVSGVDVVVKDR